MVIMPFITTTTMNPKARITFAANIATPVIAEMIGRLLSDAGAKVFYEDPERGITVGSKPINLEGLEVTFEKLKWREEALPDISDSTLKELVKTVRPMYQFKEQGLSFIKLPDLRGESFIWSPEFLEKAENIEAFRGIETLHSYGSPSLFKPSIAEVLSQIPDEFITETVGFTTEQKGFSMREKYHTANTILYRTKA